ncbi:unnamed protein product [Clonostachys rosea f. rosea IK726]|uniref:Crh-like protein n=2 Tax=Bionectria ochroleuca TaxID=29856 RepID=A0A0B7JMG7_BIOOC|nr:unnamed protein product [Clonostachys rosea f. rosea IK726]
MIRLTLLSAFAAASLVSAQTFTDCDPTKQDCPAAPALGSKGLNCDFTQGACDGIQLADGTNLTYTADKGALFSITDPSQAPTVATDDYIFFGRIEVVAQATPGRGVVTSVVLLSADLDEIDWEWVGGDATRVQSNCFSKGSSTFNCQGIYPLSLPMASFHSYVIEWTSKKIDWIIDDKVVKSLKYEDANGGSGFPQTPSQVKLGTWVAGKEGNGQGTIDWAGGLADFSQAPFNAYYKSLKIVDYAGGDSATTENIKEYVYGDKTGKWQSIKVNKEDSNSAAPSSTTTSAASLPTSSLPTSSSAPNLPSTTADAAFTTTTADASAPTSPAIPGFPADDHSSHWTWPMWPSWRKWSYKLFRGKFTDRSYHRRNGFTWKWSSH